MTGLGTTRVEDVMSRMVVSVVETDKMEAIAKLFNEKDINAAPVIDADGVCIGIITSHDIVEYESIRRGFENELHRGTQFNAAHYQLETGVGVSGLYFDEVGFHMARSLATVTPSDSLAHVATLMCRQHIHHVLAVDDQQHPIGMLSSLDLLSFTIGEPIVRSPGRDEAS